jgi:ADP-heptose:LPS heptosyltransferase
MRRNVSRVPEVFYRSRDGEPLTIYPRFCFDDEVIGSIRLPCLAGGVRLDEFMRRNPSAKVCFYRTYALGDILVLTPIFNALKEKYPKSSLLFATAGGFSSIFKYWTEIETVRKDMLLYKQYDIGYFLDGLVEKDHSGGRYSYMHRLDINCDFMGWPVPKDPTFSLPYSDVEKQWADGVVSKIRNNGRPVAVMQLSGAMWYNSFPLSKTLQIAKELSKTLSVIFIHNVKQSIDLKGVINLSGMTTVHQLTALIDCADVAITMDSGALWVAHCTKTPIIVMSGHTRAKEMMAHHRNYHAIDLAGMVGCQSCFARPIRCKGAIDCLKKSDTKNIVKEVRLGIEKLGAS